MHPTEFGPCIGHRCHQARPSPVSGTSGGETGKAAGAVVVSVGRKPRPQAQTGNHGQQFSNGLGWGIPVWEYPAPASMLCAKAGSGSCHHVGGDCDEDSVDTVDSFISTCTFGNW